jgi:hypothetical protein
MVPDPMPRWSQPVNVSQASWLGSAEKTFHTACGSCSAVTQKICPGQGAEKTSPTAHGESSQTHQEICHGDDKIQTESDGTPA